MDLDRLYPSTDDMARAARRRMPRFAWEYLVSGIGREAGLARNRTALDAVTFRPRYLPENPTSSPNLGRSVFGRAYQYPFGITPFGLTGLLWPGAAEIAARTAASAHIPMGISSFATTRMERLHDIAGPNAWYQHYPVNDRAMQKAMLAEIERAGFEVLVVTVDIPTETRRDRDLRVGLSVPPRIDLRTMIDVARRPEWAWRTLAAGIPRFVNLRPHVPKGLGVAGEARFLLDAMEGTVTQAMLREIRDLWPGKLVVKGILHPDDARVALALGADGVWVSNHGGRQLDAALSPVEVLPEIRAAVGAGVPVMADSGPRTGLDIARMLAKGADFVFLGRAFIYGIAAIGTHGADHVANVLAVELRAAMGQIGCVEIDDLRHFLDRAPAE
jgi:isopentenyl diphosphate isomerase/L-lactate dehydrogenase-like FMN-dependent dehydrogenase